MEASCDFEVDVNGEEIFILDKETISSYSGRINKLIGKSPGGTKNLNVIFQDFPGGAESFELVTRFCYNKGKVEINPLNLALLHSAAQFLEMDKYVPGTPNLLEQTEKSLKDIRYWTWSELLIALKQCQDLLPIVNSTDILHQCLDSLVGRIVLASETSPCPSSSSPDSTGFRLSCDTRSTDSLKNCPFRATWWFEDLVGFCPDLVEMISKLMISRRFDHATISRFLLYYQKSRSISSTTDEKRKIIDMVVNVLHSLDWSAISCKNLFGILQISVRLDIQKCCRNKLESMIGSHMDQATLDNLLVPAPPGTNYLYDVNLVLRFLKSFMGKGACCIPLFRLRKVASLMDLYIAEVAPDPCLKPSKFLALVRALPDSARDNCDGIYHAMNLYLEVHSGLSEEEKINICSGLNYEKLSSEACDHLTRNRKFPSESATQALISQQCKLRSLLQETDPAQTFVDSPCSLAGIDLKEKKYDEACEQIVLYAGKLNLSSENDKLRAHLQGMQWRVLELEKVCRKMQSQMAKIMKSRLSSQSTARSLPKLCS
ncbi:hypothetical protein NMG60_11035494 [Bertholletia excelsa]